MFNKCEKFLAQCFKTVICEQSSLNSGEKVADDYRWALAVIESIVHLSLPSDIFIVKASDFSNIKLF